MSFPAMAKDMTLAAFKMLVRGEHLRRRTIGQPSQLGHVYDEYSKLFGFRNWNTARALLAKKDAADGISDDGVSMAKIKATAL